MTTIHDNIATDLKSVLSGAVSRCYHCPNEYPLAIGRVGGFLADGWPTCCGATMRLLTAKELSAERP